MVQREVDRAEPAGGVAQRRPRAGRVQGAELALDVGWDVDGEIGLVTLAPLGMLELPLTLTNHWVRLVERIQVLWMSGWFTALAVLVLRRQAGSQANRLDS
jgi:hypothetical protein